MIDLFISLFNAEFVVKNPKAPPASSADDPLLDAAAQLAEEGLPITVSSVAERARVARGTIYRRFTDRDALVAALMAAGRMAAGPPGPRERILDAVGLQLRRRGLSGTTLEAVANEAGVGVVTIYRRFGDRRGLLEAFVKERSPRRLALAKQERTGDPAQDLLPLVRESLSFLREYKDLFNLANTTDPEGVALFADIRKSSTSVRAVTAQCLDAYFPDPSGRIFHAFGGLLYAIAQCDTGDLEADAHFVVTTFLHGVAR
jgi:AcrR family transcriptional regulator